MRYLLREGEYDSASRPDLILLDLNMPRLDGRGVLKEIKSDPDLKQIPVVVLTSSYDEQDYDEQDIAASYTRQASSFVTKPVNLQQFHAVLADLQRYWFCIVKLPESVD